MKAIIQQAFGFFCGECKKMRPGNTMFSCDNGEYTVLVFPDSPSCSNFKRGKKVFTTEHGLIVEKKESEAK